MAEYKTVPNQKVIKVCKEKTDKQNYYAAINLNAMEKAALDLQAGAFKLWVYFAKNQNNYSFALSSRAVEESFGIKIKQYNNAIKELAEKGYLIKQNGNNYLFCELPKVIPKSNNDVIPKSSNEVIPQRIRNKINNTNNNITQQTTNFIF